MPPGIYLGHDRPHPTVSDRLPHIGAERESTQEKPNTSRFIGIIQDPWMVQFICMFLAPQRDDRSEKLKQRRLLTEPFRFVLVPDLLSFLTPCLSETGILRELV
ncbi:hypothetical protein N7495_002089 [Penicillium taxi]|uniref:uncharacterized protein n=1 Tax=Penicillium taxi TaxID=168475 RepID=UPI0025455936|nr:uncharacterized protein N7495_002089 [Penicillium taxi]KAJ5901561.1 hypothetical protein N7495_002089 [Penicillium taxi]